MSLAARIQVPVESEPTVRRLVLTDRYLVTATVSGWVAVLDLRALEEGGDADQSRYQKTFQADRLWDLDCRDDTIATANEIGTVTLWDAKTGLRKADLHGHGKLVKVVALPPNQQTVVSGAKDTNLIVWDAQTHQRLATLTDHPERLMMLRTFENFLVSGSFGGQVRVWDLATNSCLQTFEHDSTVMFCGMNEDRTLLATGIVEGDVKIWSVEDGTLVATCLGHTGLPIQFSNAPGNVLLTAGAEGCIRSWDWATGAPLRTLDGPGGGRCFVWTDNHLISGESSGKLRVWDCNTWEFKFDLREPVQCVDFVAKKGNLMAVALLLPTSSSIVELWDLTKLEETLEEKPE